MNKTRTHMSILSDKRIKPICKALPSGCKVEIFQMENPFSDCRKLTQEVKSPYRIKLRSAAEIFSLSLMELGADAYVQ